MRTRGENLWQIEEEWKVCLVVALETVLAEPYLEVGWRMSLG